MKKLTITLILGCCLLPLQTSAQTKKHRRTSQAAKQNAATQDLADGRASVAKEIKTLTEFLYLLGGVSKGIENTEEEARRSGVSAQDVSQKPRDSVRQSLANIREGLDQLEVHFRTTAALEPYYIKLAGVAAGAADAEDKAAANHLDQAGRSLIQVVNRLTDVLVAMSQ